jgi:hypothetical protein
MNNASLLDKLRWSLPWLVRYPLWRAYEAFGRRALGEAPTHLVIVVANHFEPAWTENGVALNWSEQMKRVDDWCQQARTIGEAVRDEDGTPFRHTNFYPLEQYHGPLVQQLADLQAEGLCEVEVHLHHGVDYPDNPVNLRRSLIEFRDVLAQEHQCLSREKDVGLPRYAFVHGNLALANSAGGRCCGVDSEMQILAETGCYADFTLPAAPNQSQVPRLNAIYQCGRPLHERAPHRSGPGLQAGSPPKLPVIFSGPLIFNWRRRIRGIPIPRLDDGVLAANYPLDFARFNRWRGARIGVKGVPEWIFIKLSCHGFMPADQPVMIGEPMRNFLEQVLEFGYRTGEFRIHFATAREAFNMVLAAVDGHRGEPGQFRNYRMKPIMKTGIQMTGSTPKSYSSLVVDQP